MEGQVTWHAMLLVVSACSTLLPTKMLVFPCVRTSLNAFKDTARLWKGNKHTWNSLFCRALLLTEVHVGLGRGLMLARSPESFTSQGSPSPIFFYIFPPSLLSYPLPFLGFSLNTRDRFSSKAQLPRRDFHIVCCWWINSVAQVIASFVLLWWPSEYWVL